MFDRHKLLRRVGVVLLLFVLFLLAACSRGSGNSAAASASTAGNATTAQTGAGAGANGQFGQFGGAPFESAYLTNTYESALPTTMQLMLGTLMLEDGDQAVSAEEAGKLLPMWQALQSGTITNGTERNAVYKSIEGAMTPDQMQAIAEMKLTFTNMTDWAAAHGIEMPQGGGGQFGQGRQNGGGNNPFAALTDEQRAELRNLSPEDRAARLRELGIEVPQGGFGGGQNGGGQNGTGGGNRGGTGGNGQAGSGQPRGGRNNVLLTPLIDLLTARAGE